MTSNPQDTKKCDVTDITLLRTLENIDVIASKKLFVLSSFIHLLFYVLRFMYHMSLLIIAD